MAPSGDSLVGSDLKFSVVALILSNLIPLAGVLLFGWSVFDLLITYWAENVIVGIWNVVKMLTAKRHKDDSLGGVLFVVVFFSVHYGMFCFVHGVFLFALFNIDFGHSVASRPENPLHSGLIIGALALFASHGVSYFQNYILGGEYKEPGDLMSAPYGRMLLLHVAIILGGGAFVILGLPEFTLAVLIVLKIVFDIHAHRREHKKVFGIFTTDEK